MKLLRKLAVVIVALGSVSVAQADLIEATATGIIYNSEDLSDILGYGGASDGRRVTFSFTYNTDLAPPDVYGGARIPREADYFTDGNSISAPSWVSSFITFDNGTVFRSSDYLGVTGTTDQVKVIEKDGGSPYDYIGFHDSIYDGTRGYDIGAVVYDYYQNVVSGLSIDQNLDWTVDVISPPNIPRGTFNLRDTAAGWSFLGEVALDSLTVATVPEPGTLALFAIGILGMGLARRRKQLA